MNTPIYSRYRKYFGTCCLLILLYSNVQYGQKLSTSEINQVVDSLNRNNEYDQTIIYLENIIKNNRDNNDKLYEAYYLKYNTYKSIFNYSQAANNLDKALAYGSQTKDKDKIVSRIKVERIFLLFDQGLYDQVALDVQDITEQDISILDPKTKAFLYSVQATLLIKAGELKNAEKFYNKASVILAQEAPEHLPIIYVHMINLAFKNNNTNKANDLYEEGLINAKKNRIIQYEHALHMVMKLNYTILEDFEKVQKFQLELDETDERIQHVETNSKLSNLEKKLQSTTQKEKIRKEKNSQLVLGTVSLGLLVLIIIFVILYYKNKRKHIEIERMNDKIRVELKERFKTTTQKELSELQVKEPGLTDKQIKIISLLKEGRSNKEIAEALFISENTVKYHLKIIYKTLNIINRYTLINK